MNHDEFARLEVYIEAKRRGLHKVIDGTFDGIKAQLREACGPRVPECEDPMAHVGRPHRYTPPRVLDVDELVEALTSDAADAPRIIVIRG